MSETRARRAEVLKLARLLEVDPAELDYLRRVDSASLRELRERTTTSLFDEERPRLERIGVASRMLPVFLLATIAHRALGPRVAARITPMLASRAIPVARRLPHEFLADLAAGMDPRTSAAVIAEFPAELAVPVAAELVRRGDHVTAGRLVSGMDDEVLLQCLEVVDDASLLKIAFVTEDKARLADVMALIPTPRLRRILRRSARRDVRREAWDMFAHLPGRGRVQLIARAIRPVPRPSVYAGVPEEPVGSRPL